MMDWQKWCQLCGSADDVTKIEPDFVEITRRICDIDNDTETLNNACMDCNVFVYQFSIFKNKAKGVTKMFKELKEVKIITTPELCNSIRIKYGLEPLNAVKQTKSSINPLSRKTLPMKFDIQDESEESSNQSFNEISDDDDYEPEIELTEAENPIETPREKSAKRQRTSNNSNEKTDDEKLFSFKCHMCEIPEFNKMYQLSSHTRAEHGCLPQVKCYCGKSLSTWRRLLIHKSKHFPSETDIRCKDCNRTFRTQQGLEGHFEKAHGQFKVSYMCTQCGKTFVDARVLQRHEVTHQLPPEMRRNFECPDCEQRFISKEAMKAHHAKYHEGVLKFYCEVCSKGFYTKKSLISHSISHLEERKFTCEFCNTKFKHKSALRSHRKSHIFPTRDELFFCDICSHQFRTKSALKGHMLVHSDVASHPCPHCGRFFKKKAYLQSHIVIHTGEKNWKCPFCPRTFANSGNCRKHKVKDHPQELAAYEQEHGKKGVPNQILFAN